MQHPSGPFEHASGPGHDPQGHAPPGHSSQDSSSFVAQAAASGDAASDAALSGAASVSWIADSANPGSPDHAAPNVTQHNPAVHGQPLPGHMSQYGHSPSGYPPQGHPSQAQFVQPSGAPLPHPGGQEYPPNAYPYGSHPPGTYPPGTYPPGGYPQGGYQQGGYPPYGQGYAPYPPPAQDGAASAIIPYKNPSALTAYYLAVFALIPCLGIILAPVAFILGFVGLKAARVNPQVKGTVHAYIGIIGGGLIMLAYIVLFFMGLSGARR